MSEYLRIASLGYLLMASAGTVRAKPVHPIETFQAEARSLEAGIDELAANRPAAGGWSAWRVEPR